MLLAFGAVSAPLIYEGYMRSVASTFELHEFSRDLSDPRRLAGFADNIFVGTVESEGSSSTSKPMPTGQPFEFEFFGSSREICPTRSS